MNKDWFVFKGTHHLGPFSVEEIGAFYRKGDITDQTLVWREGAEKWVALSRSPAFQNLFQIALPDEVPAKIEIVKKINSKIPSVPELDVSPAMPFIPSKDTLPPPPVGLDLDDDLPPPVPLDSILDPSGELKHKSTITKKSNRRSRLLLSFGCVFFAVIIAWFFINEKKANIQIHIKGIMPVYLDKLEATAIRNSTDFEIAMALSLDSLTLWSTTNLDDDLIIAAKLKSLPKKVLGTEDVEIVLKGEMSKHVGKFSKMSLRKGAKFLPGEYELDVIAKSTHYINRHFKSLSAISFFRSLNKSYHYHGTTLIYSGTPRDFDKKLDEYAASLINEMLKPYQDKLERIRTFESILNETSQNYLMELEKAKTGKAISSFESTFLKKLSPILQALVVKAHELSKDPAFAEENSTIAIAPYRMQVILGKQIGELASDMITTTQNYKKLTDKDKQVLRSEFEVRTHNIKLQIDLNLKKLDEQIQKISK